MNTATHQYAFDDYSIIKNNNVVTKGIDGIGTIFTTSYRFGYTGNNGSLYRPLTLSMLAVEWELAEDTPELSHLINILLYGVLGALLFLVLHNLFGPERLFISLATTLLFLAHPLHTEVVANIKSRDELLSTIFVFATIFFLFNWLKSKKTKPLIIALGFFFLAFLSKESTISFVLIIPLMFWFFKNQSFKESYKLIGFLLIPTIVFITIRQGIVESGNTTENLLILDNMLVGVPDYLTKMTTAIKIMGIYLLKLVVPHPLVSDYSYPQFSFSSVTDWKFLLSLMVHIGLIGIAFVGLKKKKMWSFAILFYFISMALYSNLVFTIGSSFGERFLFIGSFAFCVVIASAVYTFVVKKESVVILKLSDFKQGNVKKGMLIIGVIFAVYSFKTIDRSADWKNNYTLYSTDVLNNLSSARLHYNYALEIMQTKAIIENGGGYTPEILRESIHEFEMAYSLWPEYSDAYGQAGLAYYRLGDTENAIQHYEKAIAIYERNSTTLNNLAVIYFEKQEYGKAIEYCNQAVIANPRYFDAWLNLGAAYGQLGDNTKAALHFERALELEPNHARAHYYLGLIYQSSGNSKYKYHLIPI